MVGLRFGWWGWDTAWVIFMAMVRSVGFGGGGSLGMLGGGASVLDPKIREDFLLLCRQELSYRRISISAIFSVELKFPKV